MQKNLDHKTINKLHKDCAGFDEKIESVQMLNKFISRVAVTVKAPRGERKIFNAYAGNFRDVFNVGQQEQIPVKRSRNERGLGMPQLSEAPSTSRLLNGETNRSTS
tara:strand:- start:267 stop:584 length:318 start_codon:yes stop_codon:yes gene_type:complete